MENIVESSNVCINALDLKVKGILEFFPVDVYKDEEVRTGDDWVNKVASAACRSIFNDSKDGAQDKA